MKRLKKPSKSFVQMRWDMKPLAIAVGLVGIVIAPHLGHAQALVDDPFSDYLQRSQSISLGAGNANEANEAIQSITPWPPYVFKRHVRVQGRQAVDSIERMYHAPDPFVQQGAGAGAANGDTSGSGASAGTSPTGLPVTPMQPISGGN
jgi:hypothetical protein